jgi:hypothetical protein
MVQNNCSMYINGLGKYTYGLEQDCVLVTIVQDIAYKWSGKIVFEAYMVWSKTISTVAMAQVM